MKLHKHPMWYFSSPGWLAGFTFWLIEKLRSHDAAELWLWECTPYPCGGAFLYQTIEGITWAMRLGSFSTIEDYSIS